MRISYILAISALFTLTVSQTVIETDQSIILVPLNKTGPSAVVVAIHGAFCDPHYYIPFFQTVQRTSSLSLWVAFPKFTFDLPYFIKGAVTKALADLKTLNVDTKEFFVAGHSLGGTTGQEYAHSNFRAGVKGVILLGSYVEFEYKEPQIKFPTPVLTLSGELDGLSKISRLAIAYNQMLRYPRQQGHTRYPVAIVPGATHSSFMNGSAPSNVRDYDLKPEISNEEAWEIFGKLMNAFIDMVSSPENRLASEKFLAEYIYEVSYPIVKPALSAFALEGAPHIFNQSVIGTTKWIADNVFAEMDIPSTLLTTQIDIQEQDSWNFAMNKPTINFENNVLEHQIYTYKSYSSPGLFDITQTGNEAADSIAVKFKSAAAVYRAAGLSGVPKQISCKDLNQKAIDQVLASLPQKTLKRYETYGVKLIAVDDDVYWTGAAWLLSSLGFDDKGDHVDVYSPSLITDVDSLIFPGMFYCKLLSPARVAEWIYTDGLRKNYTMKSH